MEPGRCRLACIALFLVAIVANRADAQIRFDDFATSERLSLVGDARVSGKILRLTPARAEKSGAFWFRDKQSVRTGFETTFQFQLTRQNRFSEWRGTDGFAFVLQNSGPDALGGMGSALGFGVGDATWPHPGIPWAMAVFFDTYRNKAEGDPSSNYIGIRVNGNPSETRWPPTRLADSPSLKVRLTDGKTHTASIIFQPPVLSVFLDGAAVVETIVDRNGPGRPRVGRFHCRYRWGMAEPRHPQLVFRPHGGLFGDTPYPLPGIGVGVSTKSQPVHARACLHQAKRCTVPRRVAR